MNIRNLLKDIGRSFNSDAKYVTYKLRVETCKNITILQTNGNKIDGLQITLT